MNNKTIICAIILFQISLKSFSQVIIHPTIGFESNKLTPKKEDGDLKYFSNTTLILEISPKLNSYKIKIINEKLNKPITLEFEKPILEQSGGITGPWASYLALGINCKCIKFDVGHTGDGAIYNNINIFFNKNYEITYLLSIEESSKIFNEIKKLTNF